MGDLQEPHSVGSTDKQVLHDWQPGDEAWVYIKIHGKLPRHQKLYCAIAKTSKGATYPDRNAIVLDADSDPAPRVCADYDVNKDAFAQDYSVWAWLAKKAVPPIDIDLKIVSRPATDRGAAS